MIIARALAQEPHLLLLDEPTSNLDLRNQLEVMELLMEAVRSQGLGAAICLHDINLALRYLDRLVLMKQGRVHSLITPDELTADIIPGSLRRGGSCWSRSRGTGWWCPVARRLAAHLHHASRVPFQEKA